jgi:hypothetical protein
MMALAVADLTVTRPGLSHMGVLRGHCGCNDSGLRKWTAQSPAETGIGCNLHIRGVRKRIEGFAFRQTPRDPNNSSNLRSIRYTSRIARWATVGMPCSSLALFTYPLS